MALVWGMALVCGIAGAVLFATGVMSSVSELAPTKTFASGESVTVPIDPANEPAIYLASDTAVNYECRISGGPGQARLAKTVGNQTVTQEGTLWEQIVVINAPAKGDYQLTCTTRQQADARFGVGRELTAAAGGLAGGVAALFLIPGAGLLIGIVGTVVVLVRRSGHRKRLAVGG
ncbi:hypothetical protein [Nonomuraea cypriaca]|uniref:hypothetical protein n=1 Tax=Nonomuraea cypriaca TaxID=1187855 RepID=UPI002E298179|nr:hypothetical protein [Nonomuraea cypriaca]